MTLDSEACYLVSPLLAMALEHEGLLFSTSATGANPFLLASSNLFRNLLVWFAKFCVNTLRLSACCFPIFAHFISILLFSYTRFKSCFPGTPDVKGILKLRSEFSGCML